MKTLIIVILSISIVGCSTTVHERYAPCDAYNGECEPKAKMNVWE